MSSVDPSHGALGIRAWLSWGVVHVQDGLEAAEACAEVGSDGAKGPLHWDGHG